jgi:hypothetical protein
MILRRRNFDAKGNAKRPGTVFEAEEDGALAVYLRCTKCLHWGEIPITHLPPDMFIPDVGIGRRCSKCGNDEIESWPRWPSVVSSR